MAARSEHGGSPPKRKSGMSSRLTNGRAVWCTTKPSSGRPRYGDGDGLATGRAFSAARGKTYSVWAQAPTSFGLTSSYGGITQLDQLQSYRREADQASLRITIKEASLGIYLIVKGFKPSPFLSRQRRVLAYPLYMPEAYISQVANRLGAIALTLSDGIREATEAATGMAGGLPAALVSLREWADGSSVEVLAGAMRVSHSRAVRVADRLEAAGLARRESDPSDGRRALVWLEPAGRELAERALDARARVLRSAVEELDAADVRALERLLGGLLDATTVDARAAMGTCRLCDARACGHYEGACPVTRAADRWRASA
jgi:MarR family transcriptional repressor of emrRAB